MKITMLATFTLMSVLGMHVPAVVAQTASTQMNFTGTLIEPASCTVNNSQPITVAFGNVPIGDLDSDPINSMHSVLVDYTLDCDANAGGGMSLKISGTAGQIDSSKIGLTTSVNGLLIFFKYNTSPTVFPVNTDYSFTYPSPGKPTITALLAKTTTSTLTTGTFSATATMTLTYP